MTGPVGTVLLPLVDHSKAGPLSDAELKWVVEASWPFLIDQDEDRAGLAYLVFRMGVELQALRAAITKEADDG